MEPPAFLASTGLWIVDEMPPVAAELANLLSVYDARDDIYPPTGSPLLLLLLLSALWNPVAVKQIVKWRVSTFRQRSNPEHCFPLWFTGHTPPAGWTINQSNPSKNKAHVDNTVFVLSFV